MNNVFEKYGEETQKMKEVSHGVEVTVQFLREFYVAARPPRGGLLVWDHAMFAITFSVSFHEITCRTCHTRM